MPCNDNVFENNDGSHSPNIAFEATFSQRNVFRNNRAERCKYGFWLGYSSETVVEGNAIKDNWVAGLAIEHGHKNTIEGNTFERNRNGAQFWVSAQPAFGDWYPDCVESYETTIKATRLPGTTQRCMCGRAKPRVLRRVWRWPPNAITSS